MTNPATNWLFVGFAGHGRYCLAICSCRCIDAKMARWALLGLVAQALSGLFLFTDASVSPVIVGVTAAISLGLYQLVLLPFYRKQISQPTVGEDEQAPKALTAMSSKPLRSCRHSQRE